MEWRPEISGERQRRFVQSHDGIPHQGMVKTTISWPHVMPNLNSRGLTNRTYQQQCEEGDARIIHLGDTILAAAAEARIDENWCLLDNQSTCNVFF